MEQNTQLTTQQERVIQMQAFLEKLNREPDQSELDRTPDGKAKTLPISFVEMTLDELFMGQWGTENFTTKVVANEVVGELELWVLHPVTGVIIKRSGAAGIIIQVDKAPENVQGKERNQWALDVMNKKSNALDLGYPKLKAECVKNAAQSLGKIFGRDLNRKKADKFQKQMLPISDIAFTKLMERVENGDYVALAQAKQAFFFSDIQQTLLDGFNGQKQLSNGSV